MKSLAIFSFFLLYTFGIHSQEITGFSPEAAKTQLELESRFDAQLSAKNLDTWMEKMAARPHYQVSPD